MVKKDYTETFASKVQDIRLDGPVDINTSILELLDNSIDWGKGNCINIIFDENDETLEIKDNGQNGLVQLDVIERPLNLVKQIMMLQQVQLESMVKEDINL